MYAAIEYIAKNHFNIFGSDGVMYLPTGSSIDFVKSNQPKYVLIEPVSVDGEKGYANVLREVKLKEIDKKSISKCAQKWNQEATIDAGIFVPFEAYNDVVESGKCFVIGRKGTGKTAIANHIRKTHQHAGLYSFEHFTFSDLYQIKDDGFTRQRYQRIWVILYLSLAISLVGSGFGVARKKDASTLLDAVKGLDRFLNKDKVKLGSEIASLILSAGGVYNPLPLITVLVSFVKSKIKEKDPESIDAQLNEIYNEVLKAYLSIDERPVVYIMFDQLDEEYKEANSNSYAEVVEGLFSATTWIANPQQPNGELLDLRIKPLVLLRDDIFDSEFTTNNKAKYLAYIARPNWSKESLKAVIRNRLSQALNDYDCDFDDLWLNVFSPFYSNSNKIYSSYECFIRHTSRTPRDFVELLKCCLIELGKSSSQYSERCDSDVFGNARLQYSEYFYHQCIDGTKVRFPEVEVVMNGAKGLESPTMSEDSFIKLLGSDVFPISKGEQAAIDHLTIALAGTQDNETRNIIKERLGERIRLASEPKIKRGREILEALWGVCAIGLLYNQKQFRAKYLSEEKINIKQSDQICFHPAIGVYLKMNVSIFGSTYEFSDDNALSSSIARLFTLQRLEDENEREAIIAELKEEYWDVEFVADDNRFLKNPMFPNRIYCQPNKIPSDIWQKKPIRVRVAVNFDKGKWSYVVHHFENHDFEFKYSSFALESDDGRKKISDDISNAEFQLIVDKKVGPVDKPIFVLKSELFESVLCRAELLPKNIQFGDVVKARIEVRKLRKGWGFVVSATPRLCMS